MRETVAEAVSENEVYDLTESEVSVLDTCCGARCQIQWQITIASGRQMCQSLSATITRRDAKGTRTMDPVKTCRPVIAKEKARKGSHEDRVCRSVASITVKAPRSGSVALLDWSVLSRA